MARDTSEMYKCRHADLLDFTSGGSGVMMMAGRRTPWQIAKPFIRHGRQKISVNSELLKLGEACGSRIVVPKHSTQSCSIFNQAIKKLLNLHFHRA